MLEISYPWAFVLLVLPLFFAFVPYKNSPGILFFPNISQLKKASASSEKSVTSTHNFSAMAVIYVVYALVVLALSRPILIEKPTVKEVSLRDILVCVDLSSSMAAKDFRSKRGETVNRLQAEKEVLRDFFIKRSGDNIGLIFYGSAAFIQSPFTTDINATLNLLNEAKIGMAGPKTVIGDAIGLGIKLFKESRIKERLLILMSDGTDTGSKVTPLEASHIAKAHGIKVITIAVGDPNAQGNEKVDLKTLKAIARITGGAFYMASDSASLLDVYTHIDKLHPKMFKKERYRNVKELYLYPLLLAFTLLFAYLAGIVLFKRASHV